MRRPRAAPRHEHSCSFRQEVHKVQPVGGAMRETLIIAGVFAIMAAIVGGGVVFPQFQFPPLKSLFRQLLPACSVRAWFGAVWHGMAVSTWPARGPAPNLMPRSKRSRRIRPRKALKLIFKPWKNQPFTEPCNCGDSRCTAVANPSR